MIDQLLRVIGVTLVTLFIIAEIFIVPIALSLAFYLEAKRKRRQPNTQPYTWGLFLGGALLGQAAPFTLLILYFIVETPTDAAFWLPFFLLAASYVACGFYIIKRRKLALLIGTIFSLNPIVWITNFFYIRNRWAELTDERGSIASKDIVLSTIALSGVITSLIIAVNNPGPKEQPTAQGGESNHSLESDLMATANEVTRLSPKMLDPYTRQDGAVAGPGLTLTYRFTFPNIKSSEVQPGVFESSARDTKKLGCASKQFRVFFDNNVQVRYEFRDKDGTPVGLVIMDKKSCNIP
jgi:hypothetical protein